MPGFELGVKSTPSFRLFSLVCDTIIIVAREEKLIRRMKQNPRNIRFEELDGLLQRMGFEATQRGTSHVQYRREDGVRFSIVRPHGGKKTVNQNAVKEILERLEL